MIHIDEPMLNFLLAAKSVQYFALREGERGYEVFVGIEADRNGAISKLDPELLKTVAPAVAEAVAAIPVGGRDVAMLITQRMRNQRVKRPRSWASLDRFVSFLKARCESLPEIRVNFKAEKGARTSKRRSVKQ